MSPRTQVSCVVLVHKENNTVKTIYLNGNKIGDEGEGALRAAKEVFSASKPFLMISSHVCVSATLRLRLLYSSLTASAASATLLSTRTAMLAAPCMLSGFDACFAFTLGLVTPTSELHRQIPCPSPQHAGHEPVLPTTRPEQQQELNGCLY